MFALFSTRLRRLLIFMIAVPLGGRALESLGSRLERSSGPTGLSRALQTGGRTAARYSRGPLRPREARQVAAESVGNSSNGRSDFGAQGRSGRFSRR